MSELPQLEEDPVDDIELPSDNDSEGFAGVSDFDVDSEVETPHVDDDDEECEDEGEDAQDASTTDGDDDAEGANAVEEPEKDTYDEVVELKPNTDLGEGLKTSSDWARLRLSKPLIKTLIRLGYQGPTPIQRDAIPPALMGKDVLGQADTGSGKTLAFLLPVIERLLQSPGIRGRRRLADGSLHGGSTATKALILLPTRELARQCGQVCASLLRQLPVSYGIICGGLSVADQEFLMRQQPDIVVATPGRCLDLLLNSQSVHMELLEVVILDEADKLIELGFKDQCLDVLKNCAADRQTLVFSATLSEAIGNFAELALASPVRISVDGAKTGSTSAKIPPNISLEFTMVPTDAPAVQDSVILATIDKYKEERTVVFLNTKKRAHRILLLAQKLFPGIKVKELHGDMTQKSRGATIDAYKTGKIQVLIATNLAARGLDIDNLKVVINGEAPADRATFVHRAGRTGRRGGSGIVVTVLTKAERKDVKDIVRKVSPHTNSGDSWFCCTNIDNEILKGWQDKVSELERFVRETMKAEKLERELRLGLTKVSAAENTLKYADVLASKPKKIWLGDDPTERIQNKNKRSFSGGSTRHSRGSKRPRH